MARRACASRLWADRGKAGAGAPKMRVSTPLGAQSRQLVENNGRSERIRTSDPLVPNEVRYQAALHSDIWRGVPAAGEGPYSDAGTGGQGLRALRGPDFLVSCRRDFLEKG